MARIISEMLDQREIQKYLEGVVDPDMEWVLADIHADAEEWIATVDNGISINEDDSERCLLKYELWDGSPPLLTSWDRTWTGSVLLTSGRVVAVSGYSGGTSYGAAFDLGRRGAIWNVAVHRKSLGHDEFTPDIVSFTLLKLRFWPTTA
ncbi:hypothetical protein [Nonomuraea gerenzanensis]|uniref:hypothetical protein n=1 Tax=Nonomuraea gerenzanensis TaxID=93944 RepID=UPI001CD9DD56|nr:hypothetical protein [Nonomuraea gerenzanensis]UBU12970.1 hypothetical protein LCN96_53490 [Nonomuraea gerenzanensis]